MLPVLRTNVASLTPFVDGPAHRLDAFFDRVFRDDAAPMGQAWTGVPVAMWEDDDHIHVEADLPGVADTNLEIIVHNGMLFIQGERKPEESRRYLYNGRAYGRFERVITLPAAVKADDVQASLTDGVLRIALPKSPEARPKKIAIATS